MKEGFSVNIGVITAEKFCFDLRPILQFLGVQLNRMCEVSMTDFLKTFRFSKAWALKAMIVLAALISLLVMSLEGRA
jgi:p-aminobenzoyl-glutamate transporter AbgT